MIFLYVNPRFSSRAVAVSAFRTSEVTYNSLILSEESWQAP